MASAPSDNRDLVCVGPVKRGRPTMYSEELAARICERIASGETLISICEDEDMPARVTVTKWLMRGVGNFCNQYALAREQQAHIEAEQIREIADNAYEDYYIDYKTDEDGNQVPYVVVNAESVRRAQLRIDARKWRAERLNRRVYGNVTKHEIDVPSADPLAPGRLPEALKFLDCRSGDDED